MCQSLFFDKVADLGLKKEIPIQVLSCEISEIFKNTYFKEYLPSTASDIHNNNESEREKYNIPHYYYPLS